MALLAVALMADDPGLAVRVDRPPLVQDGELDDAKPNALAPVFFTLPIEAGVEFGPIRKELRLAPAEEKAVAGEIAARADRVGQIVKLVENFAVPELERALRLATIAADPAFGPAAHRARLRAALGAGARRWEQLQRQLEGPWGIFSLARRAEFGVGAEQRRNAQNRLPKWHAKALRISGPTFARPGEDHDSGHLRYLDAEKALAAEIETLLEQRQQAAWAASLGAPFQFDGLLAFLAMKFPNFEPEWDGLENTGQHAMVRSRPLQMATIREWLGLSEEEQARVEELEAAAEETRSALKEFCGLCTPREAQRIHQAWRGARLISLLHDRQVWAALDPAKARKAQAIYYRATGICVLSWPGFREEFGVNRPGSPGEKAVNKVLLESVAEAEALAVKTKRRLTPREFRVLMEKQLLAALPPQLADRWREITRLDPPLPPALEKELEDFIGSAKPREPHVASARPK